MPDEPAASVDITLVDPMMVRKITPISGRMDFFGGVMVLMADDFAIEDVGVVSHRLAYDEPVVDCSNRIFQLTTALMMSETPTVHVVCFPSRRWRNLREGDKLDYATPEKPLLYLGNPITITRTEGAGICVFSEPEFLIRSGVELGY